MIIIAKYWNKLSYIILLVVSILLFNPFPAYGASRGSSLVINDYKVDAQIMKDGSMSVSENITFDISGSFNGVTKEINFSKSSGISDLAVYEISGNNKEPYELVQYASNGQSRVYTIDSSNDSCLLKIYSPSKDQYRTFLISYILKNVAVKYNDIGELNWKFIGEENKVPLKSVVINIKVPDGAKSGELKVFGHGPLNGETSILGTNTARLSINSLAANTFIEARVLFPSSLIPESHNVVNENAQTRILSEEKKLADEANAQRERARIIVSLINVGAIVLLLGIPILAFILHLKYNKEPKPQFEGKYYRELPEDCTPAVMSVLYNFGNITTRDITATLMDLVRKKYLKIDIQRIEEKGLFRSKTHENYAFVKLKDPDSNLLEHERYFMDWMLNSIGNGRSFSLDEIEEHTKSRSDALEFKNSYDAWSNMVKMDANDKKIFDDSCDTGKWIGSLVGIAEIIIGIFMVVFGGFIGIAVALEGVALMIFALLIKRRTQYGATQYAMWKAFKRFLVNFSNLKEASIPSLVIWEHYLVYAISLGVAKEVIKQLKMLIPEESYHMEGITYLYIGSLMHGYDSFDRIDRISSQFERSANSAFTLASSKNSSSFGGGGGFSSGSSGGGGGGGFGGF